MALALALSACLGERARQLELATMRMQCQDEAERYATRVLAMHTPIATCAIVIVELHDECRCMVRPMGEPSPAHALFCEPHYGCMAPAP